MKSRDLLGRFAKVSYIKYWVYAIALITLLVWAAMVLENSNLIEANIVPDVVENTVTEHMPVNNNKKVLNKLQTKLIYKLSDECEVRGLPEEKKNGAIILDTNNQMSIGRWMLQRETVIDVMKRYKGIDVSWDESTILAMTEDKAAELVKYLIFEKGELHRWTNCANKLDLWSEVEYINAIAEDLS